MAGPMATYTPNWCPKRCENCQRGKHLEKFQLVECSLYDDLMFETDSCPLWE